MTAVVVPVGTIGGKLDNDDPDYVFAPDLYMGLALAYDSMAAPTAAPGPDGVLVPSYAAMQPRLALDWHEEESGDWVVNLRPGVRSHAGNEWGAEDIAWVYEKIDAQRVMGWWRWHEVVGLTRIEVLGPHRLRYRLRAPYPNFPNWLLSVSPNMVDSKTIRAGATADDPWGIAWLNANAAGYGAYAIDSMDPEKMAFSPRAGHWSSPPDSRVELRKIATRQDAIRMLGGGEPVILAGLDPDESVAIQRAGTATMLRTWAGHVSVEIDFTAPPFDDIRVRHALAFATPTARLMQDGLLGQARPWRSPVKGISQWYSGGAWNYEQDIARARALLKEAGHGSGLRSEFWVQRRADCQRMAEIIATAWREIGVELVMRDVAEAPPGWLPPLLLRTECAHNLSEPIYDLAHDYVAMNPVFPLPGGPTNVGNWRPRWKKNDEAIARFTGMLCECDRHAKRQRFDALQSWLVDFGSSIFIAEGQQVMAASRQVPPALLSTEGRFYQALNHQNCTTNYLPAHGK